MASTMLPRQSEAPPDFGNVRAEFEALLSGCGSFSLSGRAKVELKGKDRVRWLNGMVSNNIRELPAGRGVYAFVLNPQGHILGDLYAYNRGESFVVDTDVSQTPKLLEQFKRYIIMDKVEVTDLSQQLTVLGVAGPKASAVLKTAEFDISELDYLATRDLVWQEIPITLVRGAAEQGECYEIWPSPDHVQQVWEALVRKGATAVGSAAVELYRIARGIPRYGQDIRERDLPQETEQMRALSFTKGCYIGQEIVERIRSRGSVHRKFTGFLIEGPLPSPGTKIQSDGKDVGEITSAASLPLAGGELAVALGYVRREVASGDRPLQAGDAKATVASLPFPQVFPK